MRPFEHFLRGWRDGCVMPILCYHEVSDDGGAHTVAPAMFAEQMRMVSGEGTVLSLAEAAAVIRGERSVERPVAITFDDALAGVRLAAREVLDHLSVPYTIFVTTGSVGGSSSLGGRSRSTMTWDQLRELCERPGVSVGNHTLSHPVLVGMGADEVENELDAAAEDLERELGVRPTAFAFPKGKCDATSLAVARERYAVVCAGRGLAVASSPAAAPILRVDVHPGMTARRLRWAFSAWYWRASRLHGLARSLRAPRISRARNPVPPPKRVREGDHP